MRPIDVVSTYTARKGPVKAECAVNARNWRRWDRPGAASRRRAGQGYQGDQRNTGSFAALTSSGRLMGSVCGA